MANSPLSAEADDEVPYRVEGVISTAEVVAAHQGLAPGESSGAFVTVAGRVMRNRPQGGLAFAQLRDWTGQIQLFALGEVTEDFERFTRLSLGDWVSASGEVVRTRRGELSVRVANFSLLARARRSFGDKWRGVTDPELRFRQREVDLWANEDSRSVFLLRSATVAAVRRHMGDLGFVEVETPALQPLFGGANARPFSTHFHAMHADFFLRIAPELYLKRLVVGGFEKVYEIGKNFRNEGLSPKHNPEFTMLEAYLAYGDYLDMAKLVEDLVVDVAATVLPSLVVSFDGHRIDLSSPWRRATLDELVAEVTGLECSLEMGRDELARRAERLGIEVPKTGGAGKVLLEIYEKTTEHEIIEPTHVMDYPIEVSPLTRAHRSRPGYAERLTPVIGGRELAEVYSELVDPDEQRRRFVEQTRAHDEGDADAMVLDEDFLRALEHGMPPLAGLGLGIDRFVMLLADRVNIKDVILFPALRPAGGTGEVVEFEADEGSEKERP